MHRLSYGIYEEASKKPIGSLSSIARQPQLPLRRLTMSSSSFKPPSPGFFLQRP